ncbi:MAG: hypothetical protein DWQ36_21920 [Acidobacteria bacterium]|nr:MAG: hypothetical protein DWQ30_00620 [Acidobacteriota bacterium]REK00848.1 MAG: hypothetical protein DWQ36_21920 [Acidobacteriota bacterium]
MPAKVRNKLGQLLLERGLITRSELNRALEHQRLTGGRLGTTLLEISSIDEEDMLKVLGAFFEVPTASAKDLSEIPRGVLELLPRELARRYTVIPFRLRGNTLYLASPQPLDLSIESEIAAITSRLVRGAVALEVRICEALNRYYHEPVPVRMIGLMRRLSAGDRVRDTQPLQVSKSRASEEDASPQRPADDPSAVTQEWLSDSSLSDDDAALAGSTGKLVFDSEDEGEVDEDIAGFLDKLGPPRSATSVVGDSEEEGEEISAPERPQSDVPLVGPTLVALRAAGSRDDVAAALIDGLAPSFCHRLLLGLRGHQVNGWHGDGLGFSKERLEKLYFDLVQAPPLLALEKGSPFWLGPLGDTPAAEAIRGVFRGRSPSVCLIVPLRVGERTVAFLYLDNGGDGVSSAPIGEMQRVAREGSIAIERLIRERQAQRGA